MKWWGVVFCFLIGLTVSETSAQNISNEGTDFWTVFPTHDPSINQGVPRLANISIYITSKTNSKVVVTCGSYSSGVDPIDIPANNAIEVTIPRDQAYINFDEQNRPLIGRGIHIQVPQGQPKVAVYAHIYAGARSAASLILPQESLGQKYFSMNYTQSLAGPGSNKNFIVIVATESNTDVIIHPTNRSPVNISLANAGDVYQYMQDADQDLTGTFVEIDPTSPDNCTKRFAVFSGSTSLSIGCFDSRDPLYQQLYPTTSWGKSYAAIPFINRYFHLRVVAEEDGTEVRINNAYVTTLNKGGVYSSDQGGPLTGPKLVTGSNKISVAQYALTQSCSGTEAGLLGDPEMVLLNPLEFNIKNVTLFSSDREAIREKYINVCMKTSGRKTFKINGEPLFDGLWQTMPSNPELSYVQVAIFSVSSTLTANEGFNAIAYGFGDHESYAYSAGTNLAANNYLLVSNSVTGHDAPNACLDQRSNFKIVLNFPAQGNKVSWQLDDEPSVDVTDAPRIFNAPNGDLLYEYHYNIGRVFVETRSHSMMVRATMPNIGSCIGRPIEYSFDFNAYPIPIAHLDVSDKVCFDSEAIFTDRSESKVDDKGVNKWQWDFGDGEMSTEQNPKHVYKTSGDFDVVFSAGLEEACMSDPIIKRVTVLPKITPDFQFKAIACLDAQVVFTDKSTVEADKAVINSWTWDFGDGTPVATIQNPVHKYQKSGSYIVRLVIGTDNGCKSTVKEANIIIKGLPIVDFKMPEVCSEDAAAQFTNLSTDADGKTDGLKYQWSFGDSGSQNNSSSEMNASHKYSFPGIYVVTLTVTTAEGCTTRGSQRFTVNGSVIKSEFTVANKNNLCSGSEVIVTNTSTVNEGGLTKVIWVIDDKKPAELIIDEDPESGEIYRFTYPTPTSAAPRIVKITMYAYSGIKCVADYSQDIIIYPSPKVVFTQIPPLCLNSGLTVLTQGKETLGVSGRFEYSGPGVSANGTFDPGAAGIGLHTLKYTFIADNGCTELVTQTLTVMPIPVAKVARDLFVYAGESKSLGLSATGSGLTYKWEPSINLDHDDVPSPVVRGDVERVYTVTISSLQGCAIVEKIYVHIIPEVQSPNTFSPNGDGINDTWKISNIDIYLNATVEIFNRYGTRVYLSKGFYRPFDGNYKDLPLPVGTYYYIINPNNGRKILTGSLTLIR